MTPLNPSLHKHGILTSACLRLLLVISLWQGPIIWGHKHHGSGEELANHIVRFHGQELTPREMGWHWHCSMPADLFSKSTSDTNRDSLPLSRDMLRPMLPSNGVDACYSSSLVYLNSLQLGILAPSLFTMRPSDIARDIPKLDPARSPQSILCRMHC